MPRLTLAIAAACAVAVAATSARADPPRWNLDSRVGYGASFTTGQSYLGPGTGLAGGVTLGVPVHFEIAAVWHAGSVVSAQNATIVYFSRDWSILSHAAVGYDFALLAKRLVVRPQAVVGWASIFETTQFGDDRRHEIDPMLSFGPGVAALFRFAGVHAGVDGRALFVPSRVAAPIAAAYGVFGAEL